MNWLILDINSIYRNIEIFLYKIIVNYMCIGMGRLFKIICDRYCLI